MASNAFTLGRAAHVRVLTVLALLFSLSAPSFAFDFGAWDAMLKKNTRPSSFEGIPYTGFDYAAVRNSREFAALLAGLDAFSLQGLREKDEKLAFWINVYNIFAVKLVCDHYPVGSIKDAGRMFSPAWLVAAGKVGGKEYSLDEIEHQILRPMGEPAVHFAIVCASVSCPDLRAEAYTPSALRGQLMSQTVRFLANGGKGMRVDRERKTVRLSRIFDWYEKDFERAGGVIGYLNSEMGGRQNIPSGYGIAYFTYSWDLNDVR